MRRKIPTFVLVILLLVGVSLLLYPTLSDRYNTARQTKAIAKHTEAVENLDDKEIDRLWEEADEYNKTLLSKDDRFTLSAQEQKEYDKLLDVNGDGIMTYIDIPKLNLTLPVYHGSEEKELQVAIGHIPGSSLPVGGVGTHCVLSGHRGLPSAKLFSDINTLQEGDYFHLITLGKVLTYEVDQIRVVLPAEVNDIEIDPEQDYCTLVTCTPYGINTHRLLVRGHRVDAADVDLQGVADALLVDTTEVAAVVGIPILVVIVAWLQFHSKKETRRKNRKR